ncbi:hypothetical protein OSB04_000885 [Centaurea solstitialis]|uniref:Pentatricopeptide repeat-containing protein n=1 Tax=Centaurea solstitialis TaxID=347529 RepID=A0AA38WU46_9ASTR|nr:hypothetical protein OSB04_000885 [Centaurea solstitialis]
MLWIMRLGTSVSYDALGVYTLSNGKLSSLLQQSIQNPPPHPPHSNPKQQSHLQSLVNFNFKSSAINLNHASHHFDYMILLQPFPPISSFNQLLNSVSKAKNHRYRKVAAIFFYRRMNKAQIGPNLVTLNIVLNCYCDLNEVDFGFGVLGLILKRGFTPDNVTYTTLVKGLFLKDRIVEAVRLFKKMIRLGVRPHVVSYGTLINGLCKAGKIEAAVRFHEEIMKGDIGSGVLIDSLCKDGFVSKAKELFLEMKSRKISVDSVTYTSLIRGLVCSDNSEEAKCLFVEMIDEGISLNVKTFNLLVNVLCNDGRSNNARQLFDKMLQRGEQLDSLSYNTLMHGYCLEGKIDDARELYVSMVDKGVEPDVRTYNMLINEYIKSRRIEEAIWIFKQMLRRKIKPTVVTYNALLTGAFQKGDVLAAQKLFDEMQLHDLTPSSCTYNIVLNGLCKNDCVLQALEFLQTLENNGVDLCVKAYNSVIDGLCKDGRMETAWDVYTKFCSKGLVPSVGRLKKADDLFTEMVEKGCAPNAVTFNALMRSFSHHEMAPKVVELLKKMAENNVTPDASPSPWLWIYYRKMRNINGPSLADVGLQQQETYCGEFLLQSTNGDGAAASCLRGLQQAGESGYQ